MPLYPKIENPTTYSMKVDKTHQLYVEECGNPAGIPVIFLHGGPGSGCNADHRRYFNPKHYRIILFDQRGCGRSLPHGCLENNTTHHLLADIEIIREKLKVEKLLIFAGSWGVTLALLYAQNYPERTLGLILRGAFLASERDLGWFFNDGGVSRIYPELWDALNSALPKSSSDNTLIQTYHRCLFAEEHELNQKAARAWSDWTDTIVTWTLPTIEKSSEENEKKNEKTTTTNSHHNITDKQIRSIRLEAHYAINGYFLEVDHLLNNMDTIKHLPTQIIHGRKDITCPVESSWRLHKKFENSTLNILPYAGHLSGEPDMIEALVDATNNMIEQVA